MGRKYQPPGRTARRVMDMLDADPRLTTHALAEALGVSSKRVWAICARWGLRPAHGVRGRPKGAVKISVDDGDYPGLDTLGLHSHARDGARGAGGNQ